MSERPYRVLFTACRSQRTANQILAHLRAGADVTVGLPQSSGFEIENTFIDEATEITDMIGIKLLPRGPISFRIPGRLETWIE